MPVVIDEMTAEIEPEQQTRSEESQPQASQEQLPKPEALRRQLRLIEQRAERLRAD